MEPCKFKQSNITYGENQKEYLPLPAHIDPLDKEGKVTTRWQLSWWERLTVLFTGKFWFMQMTFGGRLQPQLPMIDNPFDEGGLYAVGKDDIREASEGDGGQKADVKEETGQAEQEPGSEVSQAAE